MNARRPFPVVRHASLAAGLVLGLGLRGGPVTRADDGPAARPIADPWPLSGAAPTKDASSARAAIDAVDGRRYSLSMDRVAVALDAPVEVPAEGDVRSGKGHVTLSPALAAQGLAVAAARAKAAESRTVPEVASVLAAAAFDGSAVSPDRPVLPGPLGTVDRVFQGRFVPRSIDDRPYVLRPNRLSDLRVPAPPPPTATTTPKSAVGRASDLIVRGVRIDVDEAMLRRALAVPGAPAESEALDALEDRLLAAEGGDGAALTLATFAVERKQALFAARAGDGGLMRVSLRSLLAKKPGPDATVGSLTRILGVSCEGASGDVTLIGIEEPGAEAVPLEALSLAMKSVWREGRVPGCSLDPDPAAPAGPQRVRVFGVPGDSRFAKTMLEADYMMKRVVGRTPGAPTGIEGLVDLPEAMFRTESQGYVSSRFWLTPAPPGPGDVLTSPAGAAALFEARVRVRTEEMHAAAFGAEAGTGGATAASSECAKSLSDHYDELAARVPEFRRLRALFDVVTCARVLRILKPSEPLLDRLADLPYARTEIPTTYAGITVSHESGGRVITLMGGCELDAKMNGRAFLDVAHPAFASIAAGGGDGALAGPVPVASGGGDASIEDGMLAASAGLSAGRSIEAEYALSDLLDRAPDDPEILSMRGAARAKSGHVAEGILDAVEASMLDPSSMTLAAAVRYLRNEAGDATAFEALPRPVAEALESTYLAVAGQACIAHKYADALSAAGAAMRARPESAIAKRVHATLLMLTGDSKAAASEASELAAVDPASVEVRILAAVVALRNGDAKAARRSLDQALALKPAADGYGYRALARFLDGDVAGAAEDTAEAIRLDPAESGTTQALEMFRGAACFGRERALVLTRAQLSLPPAIQIAVYEAQTATARGAGAEAIVALETALAALDAPDGPKAIADGGFVRESVELLLAKSLRPLAVADETKRLRMEALVADVAARHPSWPSPDYVRGGFAQANGDLEAAIASFARCRTMSPEGDVILEQSMPGDATSLRQMLGSLEFSLHLMSKGGPGDPRMGAAVDRLESALHGTSTAPIVPVLRALLTIDGPQGAAPDAAARASEALRARFREVAKQLAASPPGSYGPAEALLRAVFHGMHVNAELMVGLDGVAEAMAPLRAIAPRADAYETIWTAVGASRKEVVMAVFGRIFQEIDADPRAREADELAVTDPEGARKMIDEVVAPTRERLAKIGDPVLSFVIEMLVRSSADESVTKGLNERLKRIDRVLDVALDPVKIAKLAASKRTVLDQRKRIEEGAKESAAASRRAALAAFKTPADMKTFEAVIAQIGQRGQSAAFGVPGPDEARRSAELKLLAYLHVLSIPAPSGLK